MRLAARVDAMRGILEATGDSDSILGMLLRRIMFLFDTGPQVNSSTVMFLDDFSGRWSHHFSRLGVREAEEDSDRMLTDLMRMLRPDWSEEEDAPARGDHYAGVAAAAGAAPPVWGGMVRVGAALSRTRCGAAVELSRGARTASTEDGSSVSPDSRVVFDPFPFARAEVDITLHVGRMCFGVREADDAAPSRNGVDSTNVPAVAAVGGMVRVRGRDMPPVPAEFRIRVGETFTLRLDRAARVFYYIVRGRVSPIQFFDLAEGPLEFVAFLCGDEHPATQITIADVRVDAASAALVRDARAAPCRVLSMMMK